jgi:hypothetical protein
MFELWCPRRDGRQRQAGGFMVNGKVTEAITSRLLRSSFPAILAGCAKALENSVP